VVQFVEAFVRPQHNRLAVDREALGLDPPSGASEARKISERTKAGLEQPRRRGAKIGRPQLEEGLRSEITQRLADGATPFAVARALGIDRKTVIKYAGRLPCQPQHQPDAKLAER
jgi:hypothetical protein